MFSFPVFQQAVELQGADSVIAAQPSVLTNLCKGEERREGGKEGEGERGGGI